MTQTQERETPVSAPERAEEMLTRAGAQLGHWAGSAIRRLQQTAQAFREEADRLDLPDEERQAAKARSSQEEQPSLERVEDMLVEAQEMQKDWQHRAGQTEKPAR